MYLCERNCLIVGDCNPAEKGITRSKVWKDETREFQGRNKVLFIYLFEPVNKVAPKTFFIRSIYFNLKITSFDT